LKLRGFACAVVLAVVAALGQPSVFANDGGQKTVHVKGYTKKDGTYVAPHDRSAPKEHAAGQPKGPKEPQPATTASTSSASADHRDQNGKIVRSEAAKSAFMRQTHYPHGRPGYVVDHIVPLACGGADDPTNMQWQTIEQAKAKDKIERRGC